MTRVPEPASGAAPCSSRAQDLPLPSKGVLPTVCMATLPGQPLQQALAHLAAAYLQQLVSRVPKAIASCSSGRRGRQHGLQAGCIACRARTSHHVQWGLCSA